MQLEITVSLEEAVSEQRFIWLTDALVAACLRWSVLLRGPGCGVRFLVWLLIIIVALVETRAGGCGSCMGRV